MTLKQLEYFLELSKDCHFSNVAERLYISQSSLSYSMSELEKDLGVKLFDHQGRRVNLTDAGVEYAKKIEPVLRALEEANAHMRDSVGFDNSDVNIGFAQSMFAAACPIMIRRFYENPDVSCINLKLSDQKGSRELKEDVLSGKLDFIFSSINDEALDRVFLFRRPMHLYVPRDHRFGKRTSVGLEEILEESYITTPAKYPSRQMIDSIFLGEGVKRKIAYEQLTHRGELNYVSAGLGVAIIPYSPEYEAFDGSCVKINDDRFKIDYYLQWGRNRYLSGVAQYVRKFLIEDCKDIWEDINV